MTHPCDADPVWAPTTVGEIMNSPGAHIRLAALHGGQRIEGTVIRGRHIQTAGRGTPTGSAVQLALRTPDGRTEVTLRTTDPVHALVSPAEQRRTAIRAAGTLSVQDSELHEVDDLITSLWDLEAVGSDVVRGYQTPAVRQIVEALEEIRRGRTGVAARILG
jgi:hypothetical protein